MDVFCAGDELVHTGDKPLGAGDDHFENAHLNFSHTHTQLATSDFQIGVMLS